MKLETMMVLDVRRLIKVGDSRKSWFEPKWGGLGSLFLIFSYCSIFGTSCWGNSKFALFFSLLYFNSSNSIVLSVLPVIKVISLKPIQDFLWLSNRQAICHKIVTPY